MAHSRTSLNFPPVHSGEAKGQACARWASSGTRVQHHQPTPKPRVYALEHHGNHRQDLVPASSRHRQQQQPHDDNDYNYVKNKIGVSYVIIKVVVKLILKRLLRLGGT